MSTSRTGSSPQPSSPTPPQSGAAPAPDDGRRAQPVTTRWASGTRAFALIVGVVVVASALKLAEPVFVPLAAGLFLAAVAWPLYRGLRDRLPRHFKWLAVVGSMLAIIAVVGAFAGAVALSGRAVADEFRARRPEIEAQANEFRARASRAGLPVPPAVGGARQNAPSAPAGGGAEGGGETGGGGSGSASSGGAVATRVLRTFGSGLGALGLALAFAALGLVEATEVRRRIAHTGRGGGARRALDAIDEAVPAFRRYLWVKTLTSAITGIATWLAALAFGLPLAWVWGFIAFLFEYVPTVGSVLAVIPPVLMALADGGPGRALTVLLVVGGMQVVLGNVVDPRLEGRLMAISPFGVLLSIVVWGWLWGAVGALLAVPLTVAVVIACRHIPGAGGVATVVAGDGVPDPEAQERER